MENKKELYVWLGFVAAVGLFILLLPTIDDYISGRGKLRDNSAKPTTNNPNKNTPKEEIKDVTIEISCSLPEEDTGFEKINKSVKFTLLNDKLITSNTTMVYKYDDTDDYTIEKEDIEKASETSLKGTGYEVTPTFDDANFAYTINLNIDYKTFVKENVANNSILDTEMDYPQTRTSLESYLSSEGYTCAKKAIK